MKTTSIHTASDVTGRDVTSRGEQGPSHRGETTIKTDVNMAPLSARSKADTVATDIPSDKGYLKLKLTYFISSL